MIANDHLDASADGMNVVGKRPARAKYLSFGIFNLHQ